MSSYTQIIVFDAFQFYKSLQDYSLFLDRKKSKYRLELRLQTSQQVEEELCSLSDSEEIRKMNPSLHQTRMRIHFLLYHLTLNSWCSSNLLRLNSSHNRNSAPLSRLRSAFSRGEVKWFEMSNDVRLEITRRQWWCNRQKEK